MAKKRKEYVQYSTEALLDMANVLNNIHRAIRNYELLELNVNIQGLQEAIYKLPRKDRDLLERYWGLLPGTRAIVDSKTYRKDFFKDISKRNMEKEVRWILHKLRRLDYLIIYDERAQKLIQNLVSKCDRTNTELTDLEIVKYLVIFFTFIMGGEQMIYTEKLDELSDEEKKDVAFDLYSYMSLTWDASIIDMPDGRIKLELLLKVMDMFDCIQVAKMKKYAGLPVSIEYVGKDVRPPKTLKEIEDFKKELFPNGEWTILCNLIYWRELEDVNFGGFWKELRKLKEADWGTFEQYKDGDKEVVANDGKTLVPMYNIGGINISDPYEGQILSLSDIYRVITA